MAEAPAGEVSLRPVTSDLSFPTSMALDDAGAVYVAESGLPFGGAAPGGRVLRLAGDEPAVVVEDLRSPVTGLTFHDGELFVSEGGHPARISRLDPASRSRSTLVEGLPGPGNYHTNMTAVGPDGRLYFSQGAMTNAGIVGPDAYELGWLRRLPHAHDVPGYAVVLAGVNAETADPTGGDVPTVTGAFSPFGTPSEPGQAVPGRVPATASVMRCNLDGSGLEVVAWGLRNAFGLGFLPDGRLLVTDQGADERGSRPVGNAPDLLFEIRAGAWYGWPDFVGGEPVTDPRYRPARGPAPRFLLANHDELPAPERPLLAFPPHVAAVKFAVIPPGRPYAGQLIVALFGDERPMTAPAGPRVGRGLARVDPGGGTLHPLPVGPLVRPIDVVVEGQWLYVLDFGWFEMTTDGVDARAGSGRLWRAPLDEVLHSNQSTGA